jgi:hypothetical protein
MKSFKELSLISAILLVGQSSAFAASSPTPTKAGSVLSEAQLRDHEALIRQSSVPKDENSEAARSLVNSITVKNATKVNTVAFCWSFTPNSRPHCN